MLWIQFVHLEKSEEVDSDVILNTSKTHQSCTNTDNHRGAGVSADGFCCYKLPMKTFEKFS